MKKPISFYFVAVWCVVGFMIQLGPFTAALQAYTQRPGTPPGFTLWPLPLLVAVGWLFFAFFQLKSVARWIITGWISVWLGSVLLRLIDGSLRFSPFVLTIAAINTAALWYLCRPTFLRFCKAYRTDRGLDLRNDESLTGEKV